MQAGIKHEGQSEGLRMELPKGCLDIGEELAVAHVDWLLRMLRPLLIDEFMHGFKHGLEWRGAGEPSECMDMGKYDGEVPGD